MVQFQPLAFRFRDNSAAVKIVSRSISVGVSSIYYSFILSIHKQTHCPSRASDAISICGAKLRASSGSKTGLQAAATAGSKPNEYAVRPHGQSPKAHSGTQYRSAQTMCRHRLSLIRIEI